MMRYLALLEEAMIQIKFTRLIKLLKSIKASLLSFLAKTVKGYGMGEAGEGKNTTHSQKKLGVDAWLRWLRDLIFLLPKKMLKSLNFYKPAEDSEELTYLRARREALGGYLPTRKL